MLFFCLLILHQFSDLNLQLPSVACLCTAVLPCLDEKYINFTQTNHIPATFLLFWRFFLHHNHKHMYVGYRIPNSTPVWPLWSVWFGVSELHLLLSHFITGIVGDILLNHTPLRGFNIFCLDMKPGFMKRLVKWNPCFGFHNIPLITSLIMVMMSRLISVSPDKNCCSCFRLINSSQWKSDFTSPSVPGFFQARLYVDGAPRDTFIKLDVSKTTIFFNSKLINRVGNCCFSSLANCGAER